MIEISDRSDLNKVELQSTSKVRVGLGRKGGMRRLVRGYT